MVGCGVIFAIRNGGFRQLTRCLRHVVRLSAFASERIYVCHTVRRRRENVGLIHVRRYSVLHGRVRVVPEVTVNYHGEIVKVSPVALTPVTHCVTSTDVQNDNDGRIHLDLRVRHRRSSVENARTSSAFVISGQVNYARFLHAFGSLVNHALAPYVSVTYERLLTMPSNAAKLSGVGRVIA